MERTVIREYSLWLIEAAQPVKKKSFDLHDAIQRTGTAAAMWLQEYSGNGSARKGIRDAQAWMLEHCLLMQYSPVVAAGESAAAIKKRLAHRRTKICGNLPRRNKDRNNRGHS